VLDLPFRSTAAAVVCIAALLPACSSSQGGKAPRQDSGVQVDANGSDTGSEAGASDAGSDAAQPDAPGPDAGSSDAGSSDGSSDAASQDGGAGGCALAGANGIAAVVDGKTFAYTGFPGAVAGLSPGYVRISAGTAEQWQLNFPDSVGTHACDNGTGTNSTSVQLARAAPPVGNTAASGASCSIVVTASQGTLVGTFTATISEAVSGGAFHTVTKGCFSVPR
jgi:hypothetical protein